MTQTAEKPCRESDSVSRQIFHLTRKELRETLRDRRTIITLLAMPLLLYPLLGLGFRYMAVLNARAETPHVRLAFESEDEALWVKHVLETTDALRESSEIDDITDARLEFDFLVAEDGMTLPESLAGGYAELGIRISMTEPITRTGPRGRSVELIQVAGSSISQRASDEMERRLAAINVITLSDIVKDTYPEFNLPVTRKIETVEPVGKTSAILGLLPLVLLLMTVTGGVYPAIDLTAGERERNTLETLMALPVPHIRLLFAKYFAVITVTMLTGLMNLLAMSVTVYSLQLEGTLFGENGLTGLVLLKLFLVLVAFAIFFSAALLALTSSARSFKEAQAYLIPLLLLAIAPGFVILLPDWELTRMTAIVPIINVLMLARDLFQGTASPLLALAAVGTTLLYSSLFLFIAARIFGADAMLIGSRGQWRDLIDRPTEFARTPTAAAAGCLLACLFPVYFVSSGFLQRMADASIAQRLTASALLTIALFVGIPLLFAIWRRLRVLSTFRIANPASSVWPGVILLGLATWPCIFELVVLVESTGLQKLTEQNMDRIQALLDAWRQVPIWVVVVALGIVPGVCEEFFFRGFLFSGLRSRTNGLLTVLGTAITFGLFHVVLAGGAAPERLIPSTLMGLLLGWVSLRTGSMVTTAIMHGIHNSTLLIMAHKRDELANWTVTAAEQSHLPTTWIIASAIGIVVGVSWIWLTTRKSPT